MRYWHGLWTPFTWEYFLKAKEQHAGYRTMRSPTVKRMEPGDKILCYVAGASRWVGVLEVCGSSFVDNRTKVHGQMGFPLRIPVKVLVALHSNQGLYRDVMLPRKGTSGGHDKLSKNIKSSWRGWIQGSPREYPETKDGQVIEREILKISKSPVDVELSSQQKNWRYKHHERRERELAQAKNRQKKVSRTKKEARTVRPKRIVAKKAAPQPDTKTVKPELLTADEKMRLMMALNSGHGGAFPAELTDKVIAWAEKAKESGDSNFGLVQDGIVVLKYVDGSIQVLAAQAPERELAET